MNKIHVKLQQVFQQLSNRQVPDERKILLGTLVDYIVEKNSLGEEVKLNFICTHNSRRSQMAQLWAAFMAYYYQIPIKSFSGGIEVTAFHPNAVKAMENIGFKINIKQPAKNPQYEVNFTETAKPLLIFSKLYDSAYNPNKEFAAVMSCTHADENCPVVVGMDKRIALPYEDPKQYDDTEGAVVKYMENSLLIAKEMQYVFERAREKM